MGKRALLNIDYTYDFVAEDGKLTCGKPGQVLEEYIVRLTERCIGEGDVVALARDAHEEGDLLHPESSQCPPHNIIGTAGRDLYGKLADVYKKHMNNEIVYYYDKTRFS